MAAPITSSNRTPAEWRDYVALTPEAIAADARDAKTASLMRAANTSRVSTRMGTW